MSMVAATMPLRSLIFCTALMSKPPDRIRLSFLLHVIAPGTAHGRRHRDGSHTDRVERVSDGDRAVSRGRRPRRSLLQQCHLRGETTTVKRTPHLRVTGRSAFSSPPLFTGAIVHSETGSQ